MKPPLSAIGRGALLCVAFLSMGTPAAHAQGEPLTAGREVRLYVRGVIRPFEGVLQEVATDDLTIASADGSVLTIGRAQIERSEVRGTRANTWLGAGVGAAFGAGVGIWRVVKHRNDCGAGGGGFCDYSNDPWRLAIPTVAGAGVGALVGWRIRTATWLPGYLPTVAGGGPGGLAFSWSLTLGS